MDDRCRRVVLSEVLGLVSAQQSLCLDFWSWSPGKFLVEADYTCHACGILSCTKSLKLLLVAALCFRSVVGSSGCAIGYERSNQVLREGRRRLTDGEATYRLISSTVQVASKSAENVPWEG
jgi:hypothetical protein